MTATTITLSISITVNIFLIGLVLILWFRRCKYCGDDKTIGRIFNNSCERCNKKNGKKTSIL